ncbi:MAG: energy-coupling factor transporter transmembrane protein EcfT [Deltaproteobacteria bacterium]|jgi:energy-coupling factor transport system permease protein|nr:energy-coupling factor transporter transmembrane protein EcfT [Deltaproteobacteria bacterium]
MPGLSRKFRSSATNRLNLAPETRLLLTFLASLFSLIFSSGLSLGILALVSAVYMLLEVRPKAVIIVYLAFAVMAAIALSCLKIISLFVPVMREQPLSAAFLPFVRMSISLNVILPLALNSKLSELANTLGRLKFPGIIKLPLIITIRFIPTFFNDLQLLREAVAIRFRGLSGPLFWLRHPLLLWRVFFMPLVVRLIRSADDLAIAAELKGLSASTDFGGGKILLANSDKIALCLTTISISMAYMAGQLSAL